METTQAPASQENRFSLTKIDWQKAFTLAERLAIQKTLPSNSSWPVTEEARKRLQRWQTQYIFQEIFPFAERLEIDGMAEEDLLALLALPDQALHNAMPAPPAEWLDELSQAFAESSRLQAESVLSEAVQESLSHPLLLTPVKPLLYRAAMRLREGMNCLAGQYAICPFERDAVLNAFLEHLKSLFGSLLTRTFVLELNIARLQGRLEGETPEARFAHFIHLLCRGQICSVLTEYPVLARQLCLTVEHWVQYGLEFLEHLCEDWRDLCTMFSPESGPGPLTKVRMGAGDTHRAGRSVLLLHFRDGLRLVYKPKSLAIDVHFQELLAWLNACGYSPALATMKILARGEHGWSEYIAAHDCTSEEEVRRFYERQGAYLALLSTLEAIDFHSENLIAAGEYPMLIDLEALFHPRTSPARIKHPALDVLYSKAGLPLSLLPLSLK